MGFHMRAVDHLGLGRSTTPGERAEQPLPDAALAPSCKASVDRRVWAVFRRAILPTTATLQHMQDAADHPPVIDPLLAAYVARQMRFDPRPLLIAQPKQVAAHLLCSLPAQNH